MQSHRHSNGQPCVFGWQGMLDPLQLANEYQVVINKLLYGPQNGVHLERLAGHRDIFSARINREDRLLFTTVVKDGIRYLTICEVIKSHAYAKAAMFKRGVLDNFRDKNAPRLTADTITDAHFETVDAEALKLPVHKQTSKQYKTGTTHFFVKKYIAMDDLQDSVVNNNDYKPTLVQGAAGSGKTCIAAALLCRKVETELPCDAEINGEFKPVLYVTESKELCRLVERNWEASPLAERFTKGQVKFTTYRELLNEVDACNKLREVGINEFREFIQPFIDKARNNSKTRKTLGDEFLNQPELMYQELRIISGYYQDFNQYEALSEKQSLLSLEARRWLFTIAGLYQAHLSKQQQIDYALYTSKTENRFSFVIADEAQDYSAGQLKTLCQLAAPRKNRPQICYFADDHQSLIDPLSKASYLKHQLGARLGDMNYVKLTAAYRCPPAVVKFANAVLKIGATLSGMTADMMECSKSMQQEGNVRLLDCFTQQEREALCSMPPSPELAVITTAELKAEAEKIFGTPLVFTPDEIKGLEFKHIVLYRLLDKDKFHLASKQWELSSQKRHVIDKAYAPPFHAFYTACTRATETLTIIEDTESAKHKLRHLLSELASALPAVTLQDTVSAPATSEPVDALSTIDKLIRAGHTKKARALGDLHQIAKEEIDARINEWEGTSKPTPVAAKKSSRKNKKKRTPSSPNMTNAFTTNELEALLIAKTFPFEKAAAVFNHPDAPKYLFETKLSTGGCLFSSLFMKSEFIMPTLDLLAHQIDKLHPFFTTHALCGMMLSTGVQFQSFPIFWMCADEQTANLICSPKYLSIWDKVPKEVLVTSVTAPNDPDYNNTFPLFWLAIHDEKLLALNRLNAKWKLGSLLSPEIAKMPAPGPDGEIRTLISSIISRGEHGYALIDNIIATKPAIGTLLSIDDLVYYDIANANQPSVFEKLKATKAGVSLLRRLEAINPKFTHMSITTLSVAELRQLHYYTKPTITKMDEKHQYLQKLVRHFVKLCNDAKNVTASQHRQFQTPSAAEFLKKNLVTLMKESDMHHYFFHLAIQPGVQCFFFVLMSDPISRGVMLELLTDEHVRKTLFSGLNSIALYGSSDADPARGVVPFVWLTLNPVLLESLSLVITKDSILGRATPAYIFTARLHKQGFLNSPLAQVYCSNNFALSPSHKKDVSIFSLFLATSAGIKIMEAICERKQNLRNIISPHFLLSNFMYAVDIKRECSFLHVLLEVENCKTLRETIFGQYDAHTQLQLTRAVLLPFLSMDAYTKEELNSLSFTMDALKTMVTSRACLTFMKELLDKHDEVACILNPLIFSNSKSLHDPSIYNNVKPILDLLDLMQLTKEGKALYESLKGRALQNADELANRLTQWHLSKLKK